MSLSKELCLRSDYKRDLFYDRFCDDLCEEILQYLSLEDKLRLQCVSKQFQGTVFQRQYELFINARAPGVHKNYLGNKVSIANNRGIITTYEHYYNHRLFNCYRRHYNYYYIEDQSLDSFKALLKKCPNITSLELDGRSSGERLYNPHMRDEVFQLIIENCNNLNEVCAEIHINQGSTRGGV